MMSEKNMMSEKKIAFVNRQPPHGSSAGRESLDALLATSALVEENLSVFFIGDGVYQLLDNQQPETIQCRDYISAFRMLELYEIEPVYVCLDSLDERGLNEADLLLDSVTVLNRKQISALLDQQSVLLSF